MKHSNAIAVFAVVIALQAAGAAGGAQQKNDAGRKPPGSAASKATEPSPPATPLQPCALARKVVEQQGRLAPQITMLPGGDAFGAANGEIKLVVACGLSSDAIYTYSRVLSCSGIGLLVFKADEAPERVLQQLTDRLGLPFRVTNLDAPDNSSLTYLFPAREQGGKELRIVLKAPGPAGSSLSNRQPEDQGAAPLAGGLRDFYLLAKANDPDLGRTQSRVSASMAESDVVRAGFRPRVSAGVGISQINQTVLNYTPTTTRSSVFGYTYDLSASMPLLHPSTRHYLSSAKATVRSEEAGTVAARQSLIVKLADAYFALLKAKTDEQIARDELSRLKQILEQAQAFLKAGTGDIIAVYEAQARLDGVIADLNRAGNTLRLAEQKLSSIVGKPVTAVADYPYLQARGPEPDDLEWWLETMEKQDPQVRQAREGLAQTVEQTKAVKAEHYPVIDATAGYNVSRGSAFLPDVETRQWRVGAAVSVPIYSGGETAARVRRAVANQDERRYLLDATLIQRRENLKQMFFQIRYSVSLIKALKQKELSSEIQLSAVKKGRSLGTRTAIDLLNAEQAYSVAQRDLKNALYDNIVRIIQLKAAAGILDEADLSGA